MQTPVGSLTPLANTRNMIKTTRGGKKTYTFTEDEIRGYKLISSIVSSGGTAVLDHSLLDKPKKTRKGNKGAFEKPKIASQGARVLIYTVAEYEPNTVYEGTYVLEDGEIVTTYKDLKSLMTKYITYRNLKMGEYIAVDEGLQNMLGRDVIEKAIREQKIVVSGNLLLIHKDNGGKASKLASVVYGGSF